MTNIKPLIQCGFIVATTLCSTTIPPLLPLSEALQTTGIAVTVEGVRGNLLANLLEGIGNCICEKFNQKLSLLEDEGIKTLVRQAIADIIQPTHRPFRFTNTKLEKLANFARNQWQLDLKSSPSITPSDLVPDPVQILDYFNPDSKIVSLNSQTWCEILQELEQQSRIQLTDNVREDISKKLQDNFIQTVRQKVRSTAFQGGSSGELAMIVGLSFQVKLLEIQAALETRDGELANQIKEYGEQLLCELKNKYLEPYRHYFDEVLGDIENLQKDMTKMINSQQRLEEKLDKMSLGISSFLANPYPESSREDLESAESSREKLKSTLFQELLKLDLSPQLKFVKERANSTRVAAFMIHGKPDCYLANIIYDKVKTFKNNWRTIDSRKIDFSHRGTGYAIEYIWKSIGVAFESNSQNSEEILTSIITHWQNKDLVILFEKTDYIEPSTFEALLEQFWSGLWQKAQKNTEIKHNLIIFFIDYSGKFKEAEFLNPYQYQALQRVPDLEPLPIDDIMTWIDNASTSLKVPSTLTKEIFQETNNLEEVFQTICQKFHYELQDLFPSPIQPKP